MNRDDPLMRFLGSDGDDKVIVGICDLCKHRLEGQTCRAFPDKIPEVIFQNKRGHDSVYPGDNGIRFEPLAR
jgi:hypothetical protein